MTTKQFQEFVIEFIKKQDETNKIVVQRLDKQEIFNQQQLEFNKMVVQRLDNIENVWIKLNLAQLFKEN